MSRYDVDLETYPWTTSGALILANGDQSGYSVHGDFINGFSEGEGEGKDIGETSNSLLVRALTECQLTTTEYHGERYDLSTGPN